MPLSPPVLVFTQGDPAGIGPEVLLRVLTREEERDWLPLAVVERAAVAMLRDNLTQSQQAKLHYLDEKPDRESLEQIVAGGGVPTLDPVGAPRHVTPGESGPEDASGALAALETAVSLVRTGPGDALVTLPLSKSSIARHQDSSFRGHTDYLASVAGLERYGRDYLMGFLSRDLQVALLSVHQPLRAAIGEVSRDRVLDALICLDRHAGGRLAVAGLNPHAGETGLLGSEEEEQLAPAVQDARAAGIDAVGPISPDSAFARARRGEFDWVLALYHDQGLIAVKTAAFGAATNWTIGLPYLRTSVDHGTAFELAGRGVADLAPLEGVIDTTLDLLAGRLPLRRAGTRR